MRKHALMVGLSILAVLVLLYLHVFYPQPGVCYGYTAGVPYPYHPIPCGTFPIGN